jgi:nucleotide-binding universal stress UspA family protein
MYKRMLIPLDGSQLAETVFPYARELAGGLDLEVVILHVCTPDERELSPMRRTYLDKRAEIVRCESKEVQKKLGLQSKDNVLKVRGELTDGYPAEEILRYSKEERIDLILMATHGQTGVKRWPISSVTDKVLRASKVPVFLVRAEVSYETVYDKWPQKTLLVPLDGSKYAESVLPHVEILAKERGTESINVVLFTVCRNYDIEYDYPQASLQYGWQEYVEQVASSIKGEFEKYLSGIAKQLINAGLKATSLVVSGDTIHEIIKFTTDNPFSIVIMASHGRSGYIRWDYGNVVEKVLRRTSSPVFLVRQKTE